MANPHPPRFDAAALARWAPPPHVSYDAIRLAIDRWMHPIGGVLDQHLHLLTPAYQMMLLDYAVNTVVHLVHSRVDYAIYQGDAFEPAQELTLRIFVLVQLVNRLRVDQAGLDFIGVVLVSAFLRVNHVMGPAAAGAPGVYTRLLARVVGQYVIRPLVGDGVSTRTEALRLTFDRLVEHARAWADRGDAGAHVIGSTANVDRLTPDRFRVWVNTLGHDRNDVAHAWDAPIRAAEQRMRHNAHDAQNELRRDRRITADLTGVVAQFLGPPNTTQADLQRQRGFYQGSIGVAQLQVQASTAPGSAELQRRANLARGALHGDPDIEVPPSEPAFALHLYEPPMSPDAVAASMFSPTSPSWVPTPPDSPRAGAGGEEEEKEHEQKDEEEDDRSKRQRTRGQLRVRQQQPW